MLIRFGKCTKVIISTFLSFSMLCQNSITALAENGDDESGLLPEEEVPAETEIQDNDADENSEQSNETENPDANEQPTEEDTSQLEPENEADAEEITDADPQEEVPEGSEISDEDTSKDESIEIVTISDLKDNLAEDNYPVIESVEINGISSTEINALSANSTFFEVKTYNGHAYAFYPTAMTWLNAEKFCNDNGGYLVTITDQQENDFIINSIGNLSNLKNCYWIGLLKDGNTWKWDNGEPFSFDNWAQDEPNSYNGKNESYVHLFGKQPSNKNKHIGDWNDSANDGASYAGDFYQLQNFGFICEWDDASYASRLLSATNGTNIIVYQNRKKSTEKDNNYIACSDADVNYSGISYLTDTDGAVTLQLNGNGDAVFSKNGYITRTLSAERIDNNGNKVYLQRENPEGPVISGVWVGDIDVLNTPYDISMLSESETTINLEIDWGSSSYGKVMLSQNEQNVTFAGNQLTAVLSRHFNTSEPINIIAEDTDGHKTSRKLQFQNGTADTALKNWNGASLSMDGGISFKLPDDFNPSLFAGKSFGVKISGIESIVPVTISAENGIIKLVIGLDLNSRSYSDKDARNRLTKNRAHVLKTEVSNFIDKFKETGLLDGSGTASSLKKLKNLKQTYKNAIKYPQGSFGVDADFAVLGFFEGTYDENGNIKLLDSGLILNPSVTISKNYPFVFMIGPIAVPMYWEAAFNGEANAAGTLYVNNDAKNFTPNIEISGKLTLSGGLGVGIKKVLYASGGLEGNLKPDWKINFGKTNHFILKASANAYAKAGIAIFEAKYQFDPFYDAVWYEYPYSNTPNNLYPSGTVLTEKSRYHLKDLSYLDEVSSYYSTAGISALSQSDETADTNVLKTNIYKESTPVLADLGNGKKLLVWVDAESSDINNLLLHYSVYENGIWSEPQIVLNDGTMDFEPNLKVIGNTAYLVWQNADRQFNEQGLELEDIASAFDIEAAVYNSEENRFEAVTIPNEGLDMLPVLCGNSENVFAVWANNTDNDWFGEGSNNSIMYSQLNGTEWSVPETAYAGLYSIGSLAADYSDGLHIAYSADTDGNLETLDDVRVFENGEMISSDVLSSQPSYSDHTLYWYSGNTIVSADNPDQTGEIALNDYRLLNINGEKAVLYSESNGLATVLKLAFYNQDTGTWGAGTELADNSAFIGAFDALTDNDGNLNIVVNETEITGDYSSEEPYGVSSLKVRSETLNCDLGIENVYYEEETFCAGKTMQFTAELTNHGHTVVNSPTVEIRDTEGTVLSSTKADTALTPGETTEVNVYLPIEEEISEQDIEIVCTSDNAPDQNPEDNSYPVHLSFERTYIENSGYIYLADGTAAIYADAVNRGYHAREGMSVYLVKDNPDGDIIDDAELDVLNPLEPKKINFHVQAEKGDTYFLLLKDSNGELVASDYVNFYTGFEPYIEVTSISLNTDSLTLDVGETAELKATILPENATSKDVVWSSSDDSVVTVDDNGLVTAINKGTAIVTAMADNGSVSQVAVTVDYAAAIYGSSLALEGKIGINFYLNIAEEELEYLNVVMTMNGQTTTVPASEGKASTVAGQKLRMFVYPVAAKEMRDKVTLTVEDAEGNKIKLTKDETDYTEGYPFSAADYFARAEEAGSEKTKKLARVLNNYGKYAQIYFNHNKDEVTDLTDVSAVTLETLAPYQAVQTENKVAGLTYVGGTTMLDDAIGYRLYFKIDTTHQISDYTFKMDGKKVTPVKSGSQYYIEKTDIAAKDLGVKNTIEVTDGENTFGIQYCALSYAYRALELTAEDKIPLQNMCRAMYLYNQQAIEYFNN